MTRIWLRVAAVIVLISTSAFGYERYNFDFVGGGARARGMGNAYIGLSDGVNGGSWNPAGIYLNDKIQLGISYGSLIPRGNSTVRSVAESFVSSHTGSLNNITSLSFIAPMRIKGHPFVGSVNWNRNSTIFEQSSIDVNAVDTIPWMTSTGPEVDTLPYSANTATRLDGGIYTANFGFGTRFYDKISFGVSVNVYAGHVPRTTTTSVSVPNYRHDPDGVQRGLLGLEVTNIDTNKFSGVNFTIGFKYNGEKLDAGLLVRTPFTLNNKYDSSLYSILRFNGLVLDDGTDTIYYDNRLIKYDMPLVIGGGIAYKVKENLLVAADLEYRKFSGLKVKNRTSITINPGGTNVEKFTVDNPGWKNTFVVRAGAEYKKETRAGEIPLRVGFGYVPSQVPNQDLNGTISTAVQYNLTAGTGIHWNQIKLDVAYTYSIFDQQLASYLGGSQLSLDPNLRVGQDLKNRNHEISFSFSGVF